MAQLTAIEHTTRQVTDITTGSSDLVLRIPLTSGEVVQFTAQRELFTPRQIATSTSQVLGLPSQSVVEYTAGNIPVVKLPIGTTSIPATQYYPLSVVSDVYLATPIDNFFKELADDFEIPETDPVFTTLRQQRDASLQAALGLEDLAAAAAASDPEAFLEAQDQIDEGLAEAIELREPDPASFLTPDEEDELAALDLVGLTDITGVTDGADDIIDPTPEVIEDDLIEKLPSVPGNSKIQGIDTINQAIDLLNTGIQRVEESTQSGVDEEGKCKFITVAKGKKGILAGRIFGSGGIGKKRERKVSRADTEEKLKLVKEDILAQDASKTIITNPKSGIKPFVKINRLSVFARGVAGFAKGAGFLGIVAGAMTVVATGGLAAGALVGAGVAAGTAAAGTITSVVGALVVPKGYTLQKPADYLKVLKKTAEKLEAILNKDCV